MSLKRRLRRHAKAPPGPDLPGFCERCYGPCDMWRVGPLSERLEGFCPWCAGRTDGPWLSQAEAMRIASVREIMTS